MLIVMLAAVVLSVTTVSRRLTARYTTYVGLYDLAVAGNEQAFFLLRQALEANKDNINSRTWHRFLIGDYIVFDIVDERLILSPFSRGELRRIFIEEAMIDLRASMDANFTRHFFAYQLVWGLDANINAGERTISDSYRAVTTVCIGIDSFRVDTVIHRYEGIDIRVGAAVEASINWTHIGDRETVLDAYTIYMLEMGGAEFPGVPYGGMILFLDEFMLEMVESLRLDIEENQRRRGAWGC